jgi:hypothetical protein
MNYKIETYRNDMWESYITFEPGHKYSYLGPINATGAAASMEEAEERAHEVAKFYNS